MSHSINVLKRDIFSNKESFPIYFSHLTLIKERCHQPEVLKKHHLSYIFIYRFISYTKGMQIKLHLAMLNVQSYLYGKKELHEICMATILLYLRMFLQVFVEYLLHTRTCADGQKFPHPVLVPFPVY